MGSFSRNATSTKKMIGAYALESCQLCALERVQPQQGRIYLQADNTEDDGREAAEDVRDAHGKAQNHTKNTGPKQLLAACFHI